MLDTSVFDAVLELIKPKLHVEVGSWKGSSVVYTANKMKSIHPEGECLMLIPVDTWLGTTAAWRNVDMEKPVDGNTLKLRNGYPTVYYQFLYNIMFSKVDDIVVPLPLPGVMGAIYMEEYKVQADTVYIDGCHDEECVYQDLVAWFANLRPGGILFGDDYSSSQGVVRAVKRFCGEEPMCDVQREMMTARTYVLRKQLKQGVQ